MMYMHAVVVSLLTELVTDEEHAEAQTFYEDLGTLALEKKSVNNTCNSHTGTEIVHVHVHCTMCSRHVHAVLYVRVHCGVR